MTVTLCKSYQKYPSLGSGKIMLGGVTVVGKNQALLDDVAEADKARNATAKDEAQLLTHFVAMGARSGEHTWHTALAAAAARAGRRRNRCRVRALISARFRTTFYSVG